MATKTKRFVEKEKKPHNVFTNFPASPRFKCKCINLEAQGQDIVGSVNGKNFQIQDGAVVNLHPSQIEALRNATIETTKYDQDDVTGVIVQTPIEIPRVMVTVMDMNPVSTDEDYDEKNGGETEDGKTGTKDKKSAGLVKKKVISGRK